MCINIPENAAKGELCKNWPSVLLIISFWFSTLALVPYRLFSTWQLQKRVSEDVNDQLKNIHSLSSQCSQRKIWAPYCDFKRSCKIWFPPHSLTSLHTSFLLIHHFPAWRSCLSSTPSLFLAPGICTNCSFCPAFSPFLIFLWLFLSFYSFLSLHDTSSERPSVTTKSKVATGLVTYTLSYFSCFS